ncbi:hypothetical protein Drorol1_Dr00016713 [Drosera rotundifolia]
MPEIIQAFLTSQVHTQGVIYRFQLEMNFPGRDSPMNFPYRELGDKIDGDERSNPEIARNGISYYGNSNNEAPAWLDDDYLSRFGGLRLGDGMGASATTLQPPFWTANKTPNGPLSREIGQPTSNLMNREARKPSVSGASDFPQWWRSSYVSQNDAAHQYKFPAISTNQQWCTPRSVQANGTSTSGTWDPTHSWFESSIGRQYGVTNDARAHSYGENVYNSSHGIDTSRIKNLGVSDPFQFSAELNHLRRILENGHHLPPKSSWSQQDTLSWAMSSPNCGVLHDNLRAELDGYESLQGLTGGIHLIAKHYIGCKYLRNKLTEGNPEDISKILDGIISNITDLVIDPFGHHVIEKLLGMCTDDQGLRIICALAMDPGQLIRTSCNENGFRVVQKMIEALNTPEQCSSIISSQLLPGVMTLMKDEYGYHVVRRCLERLNPKDKKSFVKAAILNYLVLAQDRYGCRVLQTCLEQADAQKKTVLVRKIIGDALHLSQDPFGNYVVQYIFALENPKAIMDIVYKLKGHYCFLSIQKFSSHVVEKCLAHSGADGQSIIIQEILCARDWYKIMYDQYGNYVIQKAMEHSQVSQSLNFSNLIVLNQPELEMCLSNSIYGVLHL